MAASGSAPRDHLAAVFGAQPIQEAMPVLAHAVAGLICPLVHLHGVIALLPLI